MLIKHALEPLHNAHIVNGADDFTGFADHTVNADGTVEVDWWLVWP